MPPLFGVAIRPHLMKPTTRHVQHLSGFQLALQASVLCLESVIRNSSLTLATLPRCSGMKAVLPFTNMQQPRYDYATQVRCNNCSCVSWVWATDDATDQL